MKQILYSGGAQLPQLPGMCILLASVSVEHHAVELPDVVQSEYNNPVVSTNGRTHFLVNCPFPKLSAHLVIPEIWMTRSSSLGFDWRISDSCWDSIAIFHLNLRDWGL